MTPQNDHPSYLHLIPWKILLLVLFIVPSGLFAQHNFPLDRDAVLPFDNLANNKKVDFHSSVKPFLNSELLILADSTIYFKHYKPRQAPEPGKFRVRIRPSNCNLSGGYDFLNHRKVYDAYGAIGLDVLYGKKFAFVFDYLGGNSLFPGYIDTVAKTNHIAPGIGSAYHSGTSYSYQDYFGYLSYSPNTVFNFQLGKDKHFFGDGYRSMFLSDNAANYPFLKIQAHVWKIKWVNLFTAMTDATAPSALQKDFKTKYASMQYLSWNVNTWLNLSFFEAIVWQGNDTNRSRGFDVNYMNPLLFYRPTEYSLGSADNAFLGGAFKIKLPLNLQLYSQVLLDEFSLKELIARKGWWGNKYSLQFGLKAANLFTVKNLSLLAEFNYVRPYTYSHGSVQQNYGHFNQPLADPLGANFEELVGIVNYRIRRLIFELKGTVALTGLDTAGLGNYGQNIFLPYTTRVKDYQNFVGQGRRTIIADAGIRIDYLLLPSRNLKLELGINFHTQQGQDQKVLQAALITFGFKSSLYNSYRE
jgi:hypothetical protein